MLVYRCVSEREIANMLGINNEISGPKGHNTFQYKEDIQYMHFFYYFDSATVFMELQNKNRYYDKYSMIIAFDIDEEILKKNFGIGEYNMNYSIDSIPTDSLLKYFKTIYFPEFAIPNQLISKDMIVGIGDKYRITPVNYIYYDAMYKTITDNQADFLNYQKWLFNNGTNLSEKQILENADVLFPLGENKKL